VKLLLLQQLVCMTHSDYIITTLSAGERGKKYNKCAETEKEFQRQGDGLDVNARPGQSTPE
jgi:hypothetical protein